MQGETGAPAKKLGDLNRASVTHKQVLCIESDNYSDLVSSKNGLKIMEHRFRGGSAGVMQSSRGNGNGMGLDEGEDHSGLPAGLGHVTDADLAKMSEAERQVYVESMRELVAKRL